MELVRKREGTVRAPSPIRMSLSIAVLISSRIEPTTCECGSSLIVPSARSRQVRCVRTLLPGREIRPFPPRLLSNKFHPNNPHYLQQRRRGIRQYCASSMSSASLKGPPKKRMRREQTRWWMGDELLVGKVERVGLGFWREIRSGPAG